MTDRIDEIRQRCDAGRTVRITDVKYLLGEIDRLTEAHEAMLRDLQTRTRQVEALERERDACKADFEACMRGSVERCAYCIHDDECEPGESLCYANVCGFEWRGPQEAGKGAAPNE